METVARDRLPVRDLPVVAGHLALDFANTIDDPCGPTRFDHVGDYAALLHWSTRVAGLGAADATRLAASATAHPRKATNALRRAHRLRELVNAVFGDVAAGSTKIDGPQWIELRSHLAGTLGRAALVRSAGHFEFSWPDRTDDLAAPLDPVVFAAVDLLTSPDLARVKQCDGCPWLFLDKSRNGSRRWCAMDDCGTHEKIRRYVTRRAARRARPTE